MDNHEIKARKEGWKPLGECTQKQQRVGMRIAIREYNCMEKDIEDDNLFVQLDNTGIARAVQAGIINWQDLCNKLGYVVEQSPVFYHIIFENDAMMRLMSHIYCQRQGLLFLVGVRYNDDAESVEEIVQKTADFIKTYADKNDIKKYEISEIISAI